MHRVVHFELAAQDPERAAEFYRQAFGWTIQKWEGPAEYWLVTTGAEGESGINGGILRHKEGAPPTIVTIAVDSVDDAVQQVLRCGGQVCLPKMAIPGVGYQAYCLDTEGTVIGIHQFDPSAK
jgi:predicted enzyme related to lactoylglutathione lyase